MPTAKPRITITLEPRNHEILSRLSAAGGESMSSLVSQFLELALPSMERLVVVLEQARAAPEEARAGLAAAIERADRTLLPALTAAVDQRDMFLDSLDVAGRPPGPAAQRPDQAAAPPRKAQKRGSTPVPVTRGSGRTDKGRKGARRGTV